MNLIESALNPIKKYPVKSGFVIGIVIGLCMFYPDQSSAIATWIGMIGGIFVIYQGLKEFEYSRKKILEVNIDFPYTSSYGHEIMPFMNDTKFFSGSFINSGLRKIILVDGGIDLITEEFYDSKKEFHPDKIDFERLGTVLDGSMWGGLKFEFPLEIESDEKQDFKILREPNLDSDFLLNKEVKYIAVWVKEASGEIFSEIIETPYYHDGMDKIEEFNNLIEGGKSSEN